MIQDFFWGLPIILLSLAREAKELVFHKVLSDPTKQKFSSFTSSHHQFTTVHTDLDGD